MNSLRSKALTIAVVLGSALAALAAPTSAFTDIVANSATFTGLVKSNNSNTLTSVVEHWSVLSYINTVQITSARTVGRYKTGAAATLTDLLLSTAYNPSGSAVGSNTLSINFTDAAGSILCSVTYNCNTATNTLYSNQTSCGNVALAANTEYQFRTTTCSGGNSQTYINVVARMTIP